MDGLPMCKSKRTDSKTMKSKKKILHVQMIHQVIQLQMQSIDIENNKYFISSNKMYHFVPIYNQKNSFDSYYSRTFMVIINTHIYIQST